MNYQEKYDLIISSIKNKGKEVLPQGSRLVLYGSRARGDFNDDSDWDFHILIPTSSSLTLDEIDDYAFPIEMIGWNFGEAFSTAVYSYNDWNKRKSLPYFENVERDKIILLD